MTKAEKQRLEELLEDNMEMAEVEVSEHTRGCATIEGVAGFGMCQHLKVFLQSAPCLLGSLSRTSVSQLLGTLAVQ